MLLTCQNGYENFLTRELEDTARHVVEHGPGWVRTASPSVAAPLRDAQALERELVFAQLTLLDPVEITGDSVNALAQRAADYFLGSLQDERITDPWPSLWEGPHEIVGLGRRVAATEAAFGELLRKRMSRVARLAVPELPRGVVGPARGLFVFFPDFRRAWVARSAVLGGQRRMADDPLAPSRSYLKIEEAYALLGREPQVGERVVDLGAAPGGWSYSAAKRGAHVVAVDHGPLKGGALNHPRIEHLSTDAFGYRPTPRAATPESPSSLRVETAAPVDWLFCDVVEEPHHVLRNLVAPWLEGGWCRWFVLNLKLGRADPAEMLHGLRAPDSVFARCATGVRLRHLYHDREELTVVGSVQPRGQPEPVPRGLGFGPRGSAS